MILGKKNSFNQLITFDNDLFKQLKKVKDYDNVEDLCLFFSASDGKEEIELCEGGCNREVNKFNKLEYIYLYSDYKLNRQFKQMNAPFMHGFSKVIDPKLMQVINEDELAMLISGGKSEIDTHDLEKHTVYRAGYSKDQHYIKEFWKIVHNMTQNEKKN